MDSAIDAIMVRGPEEKKKILTLAVRRLYNTIGPDDILKEASDGKWTFEGKTMSEMMRGAVSAEAKLFAESTLWRVLRKDAQYHSNRRMFLIGKTETDMIVGKVWLYAFDAIMTRITSLAGGRGVLNSKNEG